MTEPRTIRVFSVDDHPLLRQGLAFLIDSEPDMTLVGHAGTVAEAVQRYAELAPDVTLMDLRLADGSGIDALIAIRSAHPDARVVMLTTADGDVEMRRALAAGAQGYVLKTMPPEEILAAVRHAHAGRRRIPPAVATRIAEHLGDDLLSDRELEVLRLVAEGQRNRAVGDRLGISEETVKVHLRNIMQKLQAADRTEAVTIALRRGIMTL